jgi:hypothetical protein
MVCRKIAYILIFAVVIFFPRSLTAGLNNQRCTMRRLHPVFTFLVLFAFLFLPISTSQAKFGDFLNDLKKAVGVDQGLTETKIIDGLKEALRIGSGNAISIVSKTDGYFKNPKIKIPLPSSVQKIEKIVRVAGYGSLVDSFELSMNRAAEKAAPQAKALLWEAVKQMSFDDAKKILNGRDNEATIYFKDKTYDRLSDIFKPIVHESMSKVGVTRQYQNLETKVRSIPLANLNNFDLTQYVTGKALDGLFLMVEDEERKIREDPAARVTELLKEVFGNR